MNRRTDDLYERAGRLHAVLGAALGVDRSTAPTRLRADLKWLEFFQESGAPVSDEDLESLAVPLIQALADLREEAAAWLTTHGQDSAQVDALIAAHAPVAILQDLAYLNRYGAPPRDGGLSGKAPRLIHFRRMMQPGPGSHNASVTYVFAPSGGPPLAGAGSEHTTVTADVVDSDGVKLGDLRELELAALTEWEAFFRSLGVIH